MKALDRYIRYNVLLAILLVLLVMAGLDFLFTVFDELGGTNERYGTRDAINFVLMTMPRHIYDLLPMTCLMGAVIGLGILASSNELVVMQAAGIKVSRIVWAVMKPTALIMVGGILLGEYVAPPMELQGQINKSLVQGQDRIQSRAGYWLKDGRQFLHATAIEPGGVLHGVTIYEFDAERQPAQVLFAEQATYDPGAAGWTLHAVEQTRFEAEDDGVSSQFLTHDSLVWALAITPQLLEVLVVDADKMAISDLYRYASYFETQGQDAAQYFLAFWKKLLQPLTTAVLVLVAISFIFGPLREATMGSRVFVAICFGLLFLILQRFLNTISLVYDLNPLAAVLLPIMLSALAGVYLLRRAA